MTNEEYLKKKKEEYRKHFLDENVEGNVKEGQGYIDTNREGIEAIIEGEWLWIESMCKEIEKKTERKFTDNALLVQNVFKVDKDHFALIFDAKELPKGKGNNSLMVVFLGDYFNS